MYINLPIAKGRVKGLISLYPYEKTGLTISSHFSREPAEKDAFASVLVIHPQTELETPKLFD